MPGPLLSIKFVKGKGLAPKDANGFSDPYCRFSFNGRKYQTKVKTKTLNPTWNQQFLLGEFNHEDIITIQCWDKDLLSADDFMGQFDLILKKFTEEKKYVEIFPLQGRAKKETISGDIQVIVELESYSPERAQAYPKSKPSADHKKEVSPTKEAVGTPEPKVVKQVVEKKTIAKKKEDSGISPEKENILRILNEDAIEDHYSFGKVLGKGAFGQVKEVEHYKTGEKRAIKFISKLGQGSESKFTPEYIKQTTESEIDIMSTIFNEHVVQLKDLFITEKDYCIVMELVTGGELFEKIVELTCYSEQKAAELLGQVLEGICTLHEQGIVHRDLKPENLLLSSMEDENPNIKVADFGLAKRTCFEPCFESCGTLMYLAPEMILNSRATSNLQSSPGYGLKVDVWSMGIIAYIMLCGFPPFYDEDNSTMFDDIIYGELVFPSPEWDEISDQAKGWVSSMLEKDPKKRLTAEEAISHPWISSEHQRKSSHKNLSGTVDQLKKFNARRKFRGAIIATKALTKMRSASAGMLKPGKK